MNKIIHIKLKYILIFAVSFLVLLYLTFFTNADVPDDIVKKENKTTVEFVPKKDTVSKDLSKVIPKERIAYLVDSITEVYRPKPTQKEVTTKKQQPKKSTEKEVLANVYKEEVTLNNGVAEVQIISTGKVLGIDLSFLTENKIITNSTSKTTIKYVVPNVWFLNIEPTFTVLPTPAFIGGKISIDYTIKNKFRVGAGVEYNSLMPTLNKVVFNAKIGIPLFKKKSK